MKIKWFIITGVILLGSGIGVSTYAVMRPDFKEEVNYYEHYELVESTFEKDSFTTIKVDTSAEDVIIRLADREDVYVLSKKFEKRQYDVFVNNGVLDIDLGDLNWNDYIFNFNFGKPKDPIIIEIPSAMSYNYDIDLSAGSVTFDINSFGDIKLDLSASTSKINNASGKEINADLAACTWDINNVNVDVFKLDASASTIKFNGVINSSANCDVSASDLAFNFKNGEDSYRINGVGDGPVNIYVDDSASSVKYSYFN